jgi:hypothetical protein
MWLRTTSLAEQDLRRLRSALQNLCRSTRNLSILLKRSLSIWKSVCVFLSVSLLLRQLQHAMLANCSCSNTFPIHNYCVCTNCWCTNFMYYDKEPEQALSKCLFCDHVSPRRFYFATKLGCTWINSSHLSVIRYTNLVHSTINNQHSSKHASVASLFQV